MKTNYCFDAQPSDELTSKKRSQIINNNLNIFLFRAWNKEMKVLNMWIKPYLFQVWCFLLEQPAKKKGKKGK